MTQTKITAYAPAYGGVIPTRTKYDRRGNPASIDLIYPAGIAGKSDKVLYTATTYADLYAQITRDLRFSGPCTITVLYGAHGFMTVSIYEGESWATDATGRKINLG